MNNQILFFRIIIVSILIVSVNSLYANAHNKKYISVETHLKNHAISTKILGSGGYSEDCIDFNIKNLKSDTLFILIEPGRRLVSLDSSFQDILILKTYEITLPPLASIILKGYGFCCQSSNSSPGIGSKFNIGFMAPKTWVRLAEFIDKNNFPANAVQHAVWVISNNHPISSIHNSKPETVFALKKFVAELKQQELPWYSLTFKNDTSQLFSNVPEKLWGTINYRVKHQTIISVNIRNSKGVVVSTIVERVAKSPGNHSVRINMPVINWPKGDYSVFIIEDYSNINTKKNFKL